MGDSKEVIDLVSGLPIAVAQPISVDLIKASVDALGKSMAILRSGDGEMRFAYVNPNFQKETGFRPEKIIGESFEALHGLRTDPAAAEELRIGMKSQVTVEATLLLYRRDGSTFWAQTTISPVANENSAVQFFVVLYVDVTAQILAQRDLEAVYESERSARRQAASLAHQLQKSLLPAALPLSSKLDFGAAFVPLGEGLEVGGDFYDVFEQRDGDFVAVIGDVMGKGVDAAAVTSLARHVLRTTALRSRKIATLLQMLNEALCNEGEGHPFATVAATMFVPNGDFLEMVVGLAGHPKPFVLRADGEVHEAGEMGTLAGVVEDIKIHEHLELLKTDDIVVLYTDGVTEARAPDRRFLGEAGLQKILEGLSTEEKTTAQGVADAVQRAVTEFTKAPLRDDLAVLVVRVR